ncbi:MAG: hypothetical protein CFE35_14930 [Novosphingobium sp. PASSN1]|nr:MAG: hypothetical protein CFE35_14930 [Novosphingobium sp. PASSN1]
MALQRRVLPEVMLGRGMSSLLTLQQPRRGLEGHWQNCALTSLKSQTEKTESSKTVRSVQRTETEKTGPP